MVGLHCIVLGLLIEVSLGNQKLKICDVIANSKTPKHLVIHTKSSDFPEDFFDCLSVPVSITKVQQIVVPEVEESLLIMFLLDRLNNSVIDELDTNIDPFMKRKKSIRIIFKLNSKPENSIVLNLFRLMWKKQLLNVVVVDVQSTILTYEPFTMNGFTVRELDSSDDPFPDKLRNLHGHEIKVSMFHQIVRSIPVGDRYGGVDGQLAYTLLNHINATAKYIFPADGQTYGLMSESGLTGTLGDVAYGRSDVGFNSRLVDEKEQHHLESLYPVHYEVICILYPKSTASPPYLNLVRAFGVSIWAVLTIFFILVVSIFKKFRRVVRHIGQGRSGKGSDFELFFKIFLGEAIKNLPKVSSLRIYLITWTLFSYICTTIYLARLGSAFVRPAYERDLDSVKDLARIEGNIYAPLFFLKKAEESLIENHKLFETIKEKTILVKDMSKVLTLKPPKNSTFFATMQFAKYIIQKTFDYDAKRPAFHIGQQYLYISLFAFIVPNGSPYIEKFDELISRYNEHGFLLHWERMTKLEILFESKDKPENEEELNGIIEEEKPSTKDHLKVLTIDILQGAFYLWIFGVFGSLFFLGLELYWYQK